MDAPILYVIAGPNGIGKTTSDFDVVPGNIPVINSDEIAADMKKKRAIIGSIYPEKLVFDGFQYRTARLNEAVEVIYTLDEGFDKKKTGQTKEIFDLSCLVPGMGQLSNLLFTDLVAFSNLPR